MPKINGYKTFAGGLVTIALGVYFLVTERGDPTVACGFIALGIQSINLRHGIEKNGKKN